MVIILSSSACGVFCLNSSRVYSFCQFTCGFLLVLLLRIFLITETLVFFGLWSHGIRPSTMLIFFGPVWRCSFFSRKPSSSCHRLNGVVNPAPLIWCLLKLFVHHVPFASDPPKNSWPASVVLVVIRVSRIHPVFVKVVQFGSCNCLQWWVFPSQGSSSAGVQSRSCTLICRLCRCSTHRSIHRRSYTVTTNNWRYPVRVISFVYHQLISTRNPLSGQFLYFWCVSWPQGGSSSPTPAQHSLLIQPYFR